MWVLFSDIGAFFPIRILISFYIQHIQHILCCQNLGLTRLPTAGFWIGKPLVLVTWYLISACHISTTSFHQLFLQFFVFTRWNSFHHFCQSLFLLLNLQKTSYLWKICPFSSMVCLLSTVNFQSKLLNCHSGEIIQRAFIWYHQNCRCTPFRWLMAMELHNYFSKTSKYMDHFPKPTAWIRDWGTAPNNVSIPYRFPCRLGPTQKPNIFSSTNPMFFWSASPAQHSHNINHSPSIYNPFSSPGIQ